VSKDNGIRIHSATSTDGEDDTYRWVVIVEMDRDTALNDPKLMTKLAEPVLIEAARIMTHLRTNPAIEEFIERYPYSLADLREADNRPAVSSARQDLMLCLHEAGWSYPRIGKLLHRNHSTIIHGVRVAKARRESKERPWE
jgi:chromosomal replication initiation ATPase DnaA